MTGAVHLSKRNAGVLRQAQWGQKPHVEQKGKSLLDFDFQYEYRPRKRGLSILLILGVLSKRCQKSYHRDNWLVAAKRSERRCFFDPSMSALPSIENEILAVLSYIKAKPQPRI